MKRMRKAGVMDAAGEVVTFPFLPPGTGATKPRGWNRWSAAEKVEHQGCLSGIGLPPGPDASVGGGL